MEYGRGGRPRNVSWANCPATNATGEPLTDRRSRVISWVTASLAITVACTRRSGQQILGRRCRQPGNLNVGDGPGTTGEDQAGCTLASRQRFRRAAIHGDLTTEQAGFAR